MNKRKLEELIKSKGLSQEKLAAHLYVSVELMKEWINGKSLPCVDIIRRMAVILDEAPESLFDLFKPETHAVKAYEEKKELHSLMQAVFYNIENPQDLIDIFFVFSVRNSRGVIASSNGMAFTFTKVLARLHGNALIFSDESENLVVLGGNNLISVKPLHAYCNTFTIAVTVNIPVFPVEEVFIPETFRQDIFISCKKEDK